MMFRDVLELVGSSVTGKNALGDPVYSRVYKIRYVDKLKINQTEFYQSNTQGLRPELKFKMRYSDYAEEKQIRFPVTTGKIYDIIRTYNPDDEFIELTCQGVVANANA